TIVGQLMSDGRVRRAYLGIAGGPRPLPPRVRAAHGGMESAVEVVEVVAGSPAERDGLRAEDLIVAIDGVPTPRVDDVQRLMVADRIGRTMDVDAVRDGRDLKLRVTPAEMTGA
ncbi:MAG TPA: PDZ domain-containing protein, partial [Candidatus Limnocylindrales bacterium]